MYSLSLPLIGWIASILIVLICLIVSILTFHTYRSVRIATSLLFFFMLMTLIISPLLTGLKLTDTSIYIYGHNGFLYDHIEYSEIISCKRMTLNQNEGYIPKRKKFGKGISSYKIGYFTLNNGIDAKVMINSNDVILIITSEDYYLLGPDDLDHFEKVIKSKIDK